MVSGEIPVVTETEFAELAGGPRESATSTIEGGLEDVQIVAHTRGLVKNDAERFFQ